MSAVIHSEDVRKDEAKLAFEMNKLSKRLHRQVGLPPLARQLFSRISGK